MSERLTLRVFKGPDTDRFKQVFAMEVKRCGGEVHWLCSNSGAREDLRTTHAGNVHTVFLPYLSDADYLICLLVGAALEVPWIEMRIQEGSLWDYSLYDSGKHVDQFSTLPEYWEEDDEQAAVKDLGNPDLLARLWNLPKERVERYVRHWGMEPLDEGLFEARLKGKAYDSDKHEYGSIYQMFDFLSALGAVDPMAHGTLHRIIVPPIDKLDEAVKSL